LQLADDDGNVVVSGNGGPGSTDRNNCGHAACTSSRHRGEEVSVGLQERVAQLEGKVTAMSKGSESL
jgi:hypothetical protein